MKWVSQSLEELHLTLSVCQSLAESWPSAVHRWPHWILTTAVPPGGTIMRIIKCETVDVTWPTLVHTGNKRLSQERIPSLLAAKDPLSRFPKETEAGWEAPEEGWRASETEFWPWNHRYPSTNLPHCGSTGSSEKDARGRVSAWFPTCPRAALEWPKSGRLPGPVWTDHNSAHLPTNTGTPDAIHHGQLHTKQYRCTRDCTRYVPGIDSLNSLSNPTT